MKNETRVYKQKNSHLKNFKEAVGNMFFILVLGFYIFIDLISIHYYILLNNFQHE